MIVVRGALAHLREQGRMVVAGADVPVLLVWDGERAHAVQALCPHRGAPLEDGYMIEGVLVCAWHRSVFRLIDGAIVGGPAQVPLRVLSVDLHGEDILVGAR